MSREHLWPKWVRKLLPEDDAKKKVVYNMNDSDLGQIRKIELPLFELTVKDVCKGCNEGWMHEIEGATKLSTERLLVGGRRELHSGGQGAIAAWATLKMLVMSRVLPRRIIRDEDYAEVYASRGSLKPPETMQVYAAKAAWKEGQAPSGFFHVNGVGLGGGADNKDELDGYLATISVLNLVVQVLRIYGDEPVSAEFSYPGAIASSVRRIWPEPTSFVWPPGPALNTNGLRLMSGGEDAPLRPGHS
jgi:hypothetical protein